MKLNELTLKDKELFDRALSLTTHELSIYAFQNIYIWKKLYDISWAPIKDSLCVFFRDKIGCFLCLPPLARQINPEVIEEVFSIMDSINRNPDISRIENVKEKELFLYKKLGYEYAYKSSDYLYRKLDLVGLEGDKFKSKRASYNYFIKHYPDSECLPFILEYKDDCLRLFEYWQRQRKSKIADSLYQGMLDDSQACLNILLDNYKDLDVMGRVIKIGKEIKAFSFGFKLNQDTFCILYEITDLSIKGLAQFIFRRFSSELKDYRYINIMDDSDLDNLKKVKLSYRPVKLIPAYIVKRKNE